MRDCVILINDRLVSLTHNSLLLIQPPTCPQCRSGTVGTVEKVFFVCRLVSEHLIVLVHDIFDRGLVRELDHDRNHVSEGVWVKINFWKLSRPWENLFHIEALSVHPCRVVWTYTLEPSASSIFFGRNTSLFRCGDVIHSTDRYVSELGSTWLHTFYWATSSSHPSRCALSLLFVLLKGFNWHLLS